VTDDKLINAYHAAMDDYEAAKAGTGNRVETFTKFLVAESALSARLGWVDLNLEHLRSASWPTITPPAWQGFAPTLARQVGASIMTSWDFF
jgi:hypothetical protein